MKLKEIDRNHNVVYYTDRLPDDRKNNVVIFTSESDSSTAITLEILASKAKLKDVTEATINPTYKPQQVLGTYTYLPASPPPISYKNIRLNEEIFRGVKIKRVTLTAYETNPTSENPIEIQMEMAYLPVKSGLALIIIANPNGSTELVNTFEHICNTIYTDTEN